jgi:hypothetical protein
MISTAWARLWKYSKAQALVAQLVVEALVGAVLPGLPRIDEGGADARVKEAADSRSSERVELSGSWLSQACGTSCGATTRFGEATRNVSSAKRVGWVSHRS